MSSSFKTRWWVIEMRGCSIASKGDKCGCVTTDASGCSGTGGSKGTTSGADKTSSSLMTF